mmetsp:Transcript_29125/g.96723  ORF Transcript_29125/g.96723 Transcript_29125/m.96723 type:complete len:253 (-) Transcript_29125:1454-2212(-)
MRAPSREGRGAAGLVGRRVPQRHFVPPGPARKGRDPGSANVRGPSAARVGRSRAWRHRRRPLTSRDGGGTLVRASGSRLVGHVADCGEEARELAHGALLARLGGNLHRREALEDRRGAHLFRGPLEDALAPGPGGRLLLGLLAQVPLVQEGNLGHAEVAPPLDVQGAEEQHCVALEAIDAQASTKLPDVHGVRDVVVKDLEGGPHTAELLRSPAAELHQNVVGLRIDLPQGDVAGHVVVEGPPGACDVAHEA